MTKQQEKIVTDALKKIAKAPFDGSSIHECAHEALLALEAIKGAA